MASPTFFKIHAKSASTALLCTLAIVSSLSANEAKSPSAKLAELGIELAGPSKAVANYQPAVRSGNLVFVAGTIARGSDGKFITGKLGENMSTEDGYQTARLATIALLSSLRSEIGDLDKVERFLRIDGFVNCAGDFEQQSLVINGCSDLLVEVFGERGRHSRTAIGANALPFGAPVEIAAIVQVSE